MLFLTFVGFGLWVWRGTGYQYGYFKTLSYGAFFAEVLLAAGLGVAWNSIARIPGSHPRAILARLQGVALRSSTIAIVLVVGVLTTINTIQTMRWYWLGFSWNMPHAVVNEVRQMAAVIPSGATVRLSPHMQYPVIPGSIKFRPITLAFHFESDAIRQWNARTAAIIGGEMYGRNFYTAGRTPGFTQDLTEMPDDPDYLILGRRQDPRVHGLFASENLMPEGNLALYSYRPADIRTGDHIAAAFDGSNVFGNGRSFLATIGAHEISLGSEKPSVGTGVSRGVVLGVVNPSSLIANLRVGLGDDVVTYEVEPGLHWISSDLRSVPWKIRVQSQGEVPVKIFLSRATDEMVGQSVNSDSRSSISVAVEVVDSTIYADVSFVNPDLGGVNVGATYQETDTHGFWVSGAPLPSEVLVMHLEYNVSKRQLIESIDGKVVKSGVARDSNFRGSRKFELVFGHDVEQIFRVPLFEYQHVDNKVVLLWTRTEPYIFVLPDR